MKWPLGLVRCDSPRVPTNHFDEPVASSYDEFEAEMFDPTHIEPCVDLLSALAGDGDALELGIGTGRIALPLAARGVTVHGIDLSPAMLRRLADKPGAADITVTVGDFATATVGRTFRLAYLVFNTIQNLTSQDEQVACFVNVARHLEPGGCFVIEVGVPRLQQLPEGETVRPFAVTPTRLGFDEYDIAGQGLVSHHYWLDGAEWQYDSTPFRYVWPAELDLMARLAGLVLEQRWGDWDRSPFTSSSTKHVSVWRKPDSPHH
jgi:SAM-dependent methyltransferase